MANTKLTAGDINYILRHANMGWSSERIAAEGLGGKVHPATIRRVIAKQAAPEKRATPRPKVWCWYDHCHEFDPGSATARYCPTCKCKRRAENSAKRLTAGPVDDPTKLWEMQEAKKVARGIIDQQRNAWLVENSKIAFFDLETTDLNANFGMIVCGSIKDYKGKTRTWIMKRDAEGIFSDRDAVIAMRDELEKYDYICTYYGTKFDIPYINTRLILHGERPIDSFRHIDLWFTARFKLKLNSNRLAVVTETLFGETEKTRVVGQKWNRAMMGDKVALKYIVEHCEIDVSELEKVFDELRGFINFSSKPTKKFGGRY